MGTKGIFILLVNEDIACRNIVSEMLQHCSYEGLYIKRVAADVFNAIRERKDSLEHVLTNVHRFGSEWEKFAKNIQREFNLPVTLMKPDEMDILSEGQKYSFSAYILKGLSKQEVNNRWKIAIEKVNQKLPAISQQENFQRKENVKPSSSISEPSKRKRIEMEKSEGTKEEDLKQKKQRVVWSSEMHQKFVEVIDALGGPENAVPKKIVEKMGVEGLTRENVASHLQKHRGGKKRVEEILKAASLSNTSPRNEFNNASFFLPPESASGINSLQRSSYYTENNGFNNLYLQRSSYIPQNSTYLNIQNKLPIHNYSEQKPYAYMDNLQFRNKNLDEVEEKYIPKVQLNGTFRIYNDHKKNMLYSINNCSKFVGYRLTHNGNSINFGGTNQSLATDDICFVQPNHLKNPSLPFFQSQDETEYLVQSLRDCINESYDSLPNEVTDVQEYGTLQNEGPLWNTSANEMQLQDLSEHENSVDASSSTYVPDQDFLLAETQTTILQDDSHFLDQMGIDSLVMNETVTVIPKFDLEEFDDIIFDYGT